MKKKGITLIMAFLMILALWGFAKAAAHKCWVPYNIKQPGWWTGLHIIANSPAEHLTVEFWHLEGGAWDKYATVTLDSDDLPWTGYVWDLLDNPESFRDKTLLMFHSTIGEFTVTQFVGNTSSTNMGFGFQTFYSWPESQVFPYGASLSSPPGEGPLGEGNDAKRMR